MTLPDVQRLFRYWKNNPPLRNLVAAIGHALGVKVTPETIDTSKHLGFDDFKRMMAATGGKIDGLSKLGGA